MIFQVQYDKQRMGNTSHNKKTAKEERGIRNSEKNQIIKNNK